MAARTKAAVLRLRWQSHIRINEQHKLTVFDSKSRFYQVSVTSCPLGFKGGRSLTARLTRGKRGSEEDSIRKWLFL